MGLCRCLTACLHTVGEPGHLLTHPPPTLACRLQADFHMFELLTLPVTGIVGRTYPTDMGTQPVSDLEVSIEGEADHSRSLHANSVEAVASIFI